MFRVRLGDPRITVGDSNEQADVGFHLQLVL